jgi:RNA polymerase sigma factor (sigma-70 family)
MPPIEGDGDPPGGGVDEARLALADTYRRHFELLRDIAEKKFRVPSADAVALVNDIFLSILARRPTVRDERKWLIGAVCHASRGYWRKAMRYIPLPPDIEDHVDPGARDAEKCIVDRVTMAAALNHLPPKCRETLRLFYTEGYSTAEIAERLDTTTGYVTQLLHSCRKRCRQIYVALLEQRQGE